jgi:hypothetical protein
MEPNLAGRIYGRSSIKFLRFVPFGQQIWLSRAILVSDWLMLKKTYNFIISVMAARPIKFTERSKSGKKHPLPIDLSTEKKKAKRSAYEKERRPGRSFNRKWKDKMNKQMTT